MREPWWPSERRSSSRRRGRTGPFENDDTHRFDVQGRSPGGRPVTLRNGLLNLLFQQGAHSCP